MNLFKFFEKEIKPPIKEQIKQKEKELEPKLELMITDMTNKNCPFMEFNCNRNCVHFNKGSVYVSDWNGGIVYAINKPSCKLWQ